MTATAVERLERRYNQLSGQRDNANFVRLIRTYVDALDGEPQAKRILKRLTEDAEEAVERFNATTHALLSEAVGIRTRLAEAAPEIDNSNAPEPDVRSHDYRAWELDSLASFDRLARTDKRVEFMPLEYYDTGDRTVLGTMVIILRGRLRQAQYGDQGGLLSEQENLRPDLDDFGRKVHNLQEKHGHSLREFKEQGTALPGLAYERLHAFAYALQREPFLIEADADEAQLAERLFTRGLEELSAVGITRRAVAGERLDVGERQVFERLAQYLREEAERLHEEVVPRLGRGEGESCLRLVVTFIGRGSAKVGWLIVSAVIAAVIGLLVSAYISKWFPGQDDNHRTPTTKSTMGRPQEPSAEGHRGRQPANALLTNPLARLDT